MIKHEKQLDWADATAHGARKQVTRLFSTMSFRDKVKWIEETEQVALRFKRVRPEESAKGDEHDLVKSG